MSSVSKSPSITMYIIHVGIFYILILVILISARARVANHCHCHWIAIYMLLYLVNVLTVVMPVSNGLKLGQ